MSTSISLRALGALALACGAGAAPTLAQAQSTVTLYGIVDASARVASNANARGDSAKSLGDGAYGASRFGVRGTEDLGSGARAFFSLEQGFDPSNGTFQQATASANYGQSAAPTGRVWGREALVGLSHSMGTLTLGRQYTLAHQMSGRFQPQSNPNLDAISVFSGHHVARQDNMVKLESRFGAFTAALNVTGAQGNGKAWGLAGRYNAGPVEMVAYAQEMKSFNGAETRKILGLGGNYAVSPTVKLYLGGMKRDHAVSQQENTVLTAGVNFNATSQLVLTASYTRDRQSEVNAGTRQVAFVGADYFLSKRTDVYVVADRNELSGRYPLPGFMGTREGKTGVSLGLRHRF